MQSLAKALTFNNTLVELNLFDNNIGVEGAKSLAEMLKIYQTLTELNLKYNCIGDEGARFLDEALKISRSRQNSISNLITSATKKRMPFPTP